jgi:hypothetical protein
MTIEFARNVLGMTGANSTEFDPTTKYPVIDLMHDQRDVTDMGGTMRLGAYYAVLTPDSKVAAAYGEPVVSERHRHRYEFNPQFRTRFEEAGFVCSGHVARQAARRVHRAADHPFWVATQAHPEFKSRPTAAPAVPRADPRRVVVPRQHAAALRRMLDRGRRARGRRRGRETADRWVHDRVPSPRRRAGPPGPHLVRRRRRLRGAGRQRFRRDIVRSPGSVGVVPLVFDAEGVASVVLVSQYRPPYERAIIEIPAGMRDVPGEDPAETGRRELVEEAGLAAGEIFHLVDMLPSPGMTDSVCSIFLATGCSRSSTTATGPRSNTWRCSTCPSTRRCR